MILNMETRRIQLTGGSSLMVTLPKSWTESIGLKKNDKVDLIPQAGGGLLITLNGQGVETPGTKVIDGDSITGVALFRCLVGAYIAGHDQISVVSKDILPGSSIQAVSRFTQTSIGMEIVEEDEDHIVMKDLMDHTEIIPKKNVRREYLLVKRMISDVMVRLGPEDLPRISGMNQRDTEVDRIHWLIQRQSSIHQLDISLCNRMGIDLRSVTNCVAVSKTLERMGDHAVLIASHLSSLGEKDLDGVSTVLGELSDSVLNLFDGTVNAWFESDWKTAEACIDAKRDILDRITELFTGLPDSDIVTNIHGSCRRFVEYCSDIAESSINLAMESDSEETN